MDKLFAFLDFRVFVCNLCLRLQISEWKKVHNGHLRHEAGLYIRVVWGHSGQILVYLHIFGRFAETLVRLDELYFDPILKKILNICYSYLLR